MPKISGGVVKVNPFHLDDAASTFTSKVEPRVEHVTLTLAEHLTTNIGAPFDAGFGNAINDLYNAATSMQSVIDEIGPALTSASEAYRGADISTSTGGRSGHGATA